MPGVTTASLQIRLHSPSLTEELVRFLRRMGVRAEEVDYGVVALLPSASLDETSVRAYLRIWQGVHDRVALDLEPVSAA